MVLNLQRLNKQEIMLGSDSELTPYFTTVPETLTNLAHGKPSETKVIIQQVLSPECGDSGKTQWWAILDANEEWSG